MLLRALLLLAQSDSSAPQIPGSQAGGDASGQGAVGEQLAEVVDRATSVPRFEDFDLEQFLADIAPAVFGLAVRLLGVAVLLFVAWLLSRWVRRVVDRALEKTRTDPTHQKFLRNVSGWGVIFLGLIVSLSIFGVNTTTFAAILGAAGLAIGLGFQGALANFSAGLLLLMFKPFRVGDLVEVDGELGIVEEIELYFTRINKFDKRHVILPNDDVLGNKIENVSRNEIRRVEVEIGIAYGADPDHTQEVLDEVVAKFESEVSEETNRAVFMGYGDSAQNWELWVYCHWRDWLDVREKLCKAAWHALHDAGIEIPFPQRTLQFAEALRVDMDGRRADDSADDDANGDGRRRDAQRTRTRVDMDESLHDDDGDQE